MSDSTLAAAIAQAQQSVARHEAQNVGDPFHFDLTEHRYVALRDLLAALSTPPADDVREALAKAVCASEERADSTLGGYVAGVQMWRRFTHEAERLIAELADRGLEVRPRGTVTDAEVGAAARAMSPRADRWSDFVGVARKALEAAREVHP